MASAALVLLALAGAISLLFGIRYLRAKQFMPYHAVVAGKSWAELDRGVQTIILGMLRIIGLPTLYVTITLRKAAPAARTPTVPALVVLAMAVAGAAISFFA